jgi:hypothetical protein
MARKVGFMIRDTNLAKRSVSGVWKGEFGDRTADPRRKRYDTNPRDVKAKTTMATERWTVHRYTERAVANKRRASCRSKGNI